jgi:hypothetical protein
MINITIINNGILYSKGDKMGRPIKKKWFGPAGTPGAQIVVTGVRWADNTTASDAYIVKQTGSAAYVVSNGTKAEICFMVNADSVGALLPSQCYINVTPFGGSALPSETIAQYRVSTYDVPNSVPREVGNPAVSPVSNYSWSTQPANASGQADLITAAELGGPVNTIAPVASGSTTAGSTLSVTTGTWTGTPTITYSYQWTLDGGNVGTDSATSPTTVAGTYLCVVTATNGVGSASASSNSIVVT